MKREKKVARYMRDLLALAVLLELVSFLRPLLRGFLRGFVEGLVRPSNEEGGK